MNFPDWTKPGIIGAAGGAIAISILGFTWGGWTTHMTAEDMAETHARGEVALAMVPVCLDMSEADPDRIEKIAALQESSGFNRRRAMMETGWATVPGTDAPNRDLATACIEGLEIDGS